MGLTKRLSLRASLIVLAVSAAACGSSSSTPPAPTYTLSGTVTRAICATGAACLVPVGNVTARLTGAATATATTDAAGAFSFTGLADGTYTVTPSLDGYFFTPGAPSVVLGAANKTQDFTAASVVANVSISGTVTYPVGSKTGRVYLTVSASSCPNCGGMAGTSIAVPGAYTIRGLTPGSYVVSARRDSLGRGFRNVSDPVGVTGTVTVGAANVTAGADITLTDPPPQAPDALAAPQLIAGKNGMLVFWNVDRDGFGTEKATTYDVSWGTTAAADTTVVNVPALDDGVYLKGGLADGTPYYFKVRSNVGATNGTYSPITSATAGAVATNYSVSGTVAFTGTATGPLYVAVGDPNSMNMQVAAYPTPASSPASFTVTGVPLGSWTVYAIIDQNNNGVIDEGDLRNVNANNAPIVTVTGNTTGAAVTLASAKGTAATTTEHSMSADATPVVGYSLQNFLNDGVGRVVNVTILSGKNIPVPVDLARERQHDLWRGLGTTVPGVGDTYRYEVLYADGSSEILTSSVTAVLNSFATALTETTTGLGSVGQPLFSWTAPASPPAGIWGYSVSLRGNTVSANWDYPRDAPMVDNTITSVRYNAGGTATPSSLSTGSYTWMVSVIDALGNRARQDKSYVVP
jgi:uncharacterized protein (DUF2141 family)